MEKVLLAGDTPFLRDLISFLLKMAGFDLTLVRDLEEAINMIEINRSLSSKFDLLIVEESEINDGTEEYFRFVNNLLKKTKVLLIGNAESAILGKSDRESRFQSENIFRCTLENLVFEVKKIFKQSKSNENFELPDRKQGYRPSELDLKR